MKLIFVYNADSDFVSSVKDMAHKFLSPKTYSCNLCRITYPRIFIDGEWKKFIESLPYEVLFLHRDEFIKRYPSQKSIQLPAVFLGNSSSLNLIITSDRINKTKNVRELIKTIKDSL